MTDLWQQDQQQTEQQLEEVSNRIDEVASSLSKPAPKEKVEPTPVKEPVPEKKNEPVIVIEKEGDDRPDSTFIESHGALKDFFEITGELGSTESNKLRAIWEYVRAKSPKQPLNEYVYQLRRLESKIGPPHIGQSRLNKLYAYINAQRMVENAERWRDGIVTK